MDGHASCGGGSSSFATGGATSSVATPAVAARAVIASVACIHRTRIRCTAVVAAETTVEKMTMRIRSRSSCRSSCSSCIGCVHCRGRRRTNMLLGW